MSARAALLELINSLENEIQMAAIDPDEAMFPEHEEIISAFGQTIEVIRQIYPMIQASDEIIRGDISPGLFLHKWRKISSYFRNWDDAAQEIGSEVKGLLGKFGNEGEGT